MILVTGATGFVGAALVARLARDKVPVRACVHRRAIEPMDGVESVRVGELGDAFDWRAALEGVAVVVHVAARAHVMHETDADPQITYRRTNVDGTLALARQAAATGVRRFVFISSVKVNGETGLFRESDAPAPGDPYGISKMEAEQGLRRIADESGMEVVIIRPPLVYGPGVRANFRSLMRAVARGWPLPLGAIDNRRSLVGLDNLVDFIVTCVRHPQAANETFLVSDGDDVSTPELVRRLARAMGRPARLIPVPVWMLEAGAALLGRRAAVQRLCSSLQVDGSKARQLLGWAPPLTLEEGLRRAVREYVREAAV